jgi:hypothetical protein
MAARLALQRTRALVFALVPPPSAAPRVHLLAAVAQVATAARWVAASLVLSAQLAPPIVARRSAWSTSSTSWRLKRRTPHEHSTAFDAA